MSYTPVPPPPIWPDPPFTKKPLGQAPDPINRNVGLVVAIVIGILVLGIAGVLSYLYWEPGKVRSRRLEVISGRIGLHEPGRSFNFSVAMPQNWSVDEWFPYDYDAMPAGYLIGFADNRRFRITYMAFAPTDDKSPIARFEDRHRTWRERVEDVEITFFEPLVYADEPGLRAGAIVPRVPGSPEGIETLAVQVFADRPTAEQGALVEKVARSMRYARPPEEPDRYEPQASIGEDWTRARAGTDSRGPFRFSLLLPPGWTITNSISYDSLVGAIEGDGIKFTYELGQEGIIQQLPRYGAQLLWYEEIDGEIVHFVRPRRLPEDTDLAIGAYFIRLPGSCYGPGVRSLVVTTKGLSVQQQDLALAILKTIRDEDANC